MVSLFISLALLGLAAVDPIGIAAMPLLLSQKRPVVRSLIFLLGSFIALIALGFVLAMGLGAIILQFEMAHTWLIPTIEIAAGAVLLLVAVFMIWHTSKQPSLGKPSTAIANRLSLGNWQLFSFGAILVTVQSAVDVVFVVAMIRVQTLHLQPALLTLSVATYAIAALLLQLLIVAIYSMTPQEQRTNVLRRTSRLIARYADRTVIVVSTLLGTGLIVSGAASVLAGSHF